jgi:hypothetical protein
MHWVLQNDIFNEAGWTALVETLQRLELPHSIHKVVPFVGELQPEPQLPHRNAICLGSYSMRHAARRYGWQPGVFDLIEQTFERQLERWGAHLLNARSRVCRFGDAVFDDELMFIRPVSDSKVFAGRVYSREELVPWQRAVCELGEDDGSTLRADTLIQVAPPVVIHAEYRYWVVKGRIVTRSQYKRGDRVVASPTVDPLFDVYVEARIAEWQPAEAFVIDVCDTPAGPRIVEINTLNSAGFYAADVQRLVMALDDAFTEPPQQNRHHV